MEPSSKKSSSLPGVATTMCGRRFRDSSCLALSVPPVRHETRSTSQCLRIFFETAVSCCPNSRVGTKTSARGLGGRVDMSSPSSARLQAMGSRNDSDLPLPGFDMQYTLLPWSIMGHARACNGSGEMRSASKNMQILSWSPVEEAGEAAPSPAPGLPCCFGTMRLVPVESFGLELARISSSDESSCRAGSDQQGPRMMRFVVRRFRTLFSPPASLFNVRFHAFLFLFLES
mmetsp:Transcript_788/g.2094  ORF Transcript_788/g.2094 Transcript_788/m.2094 type:complete len:230 (+) Transcript_788:1185-1874(+)